MILKIPFNVPSTIYPKRKTKRKSEDVLRVPSWTQISKSLKEMNECKFVYFPAIDYMQERLAGDYSTPSVVDIIPAELIDPIFEDGNLCITVPENLSSLQTHIENDEVRASIVGVYHVNSSQAVVIDNIYYIMIYRLVNTKEGDI